MIDIEINKKNLRKLTSIILKNLQDDLKKTKNKKEKIALYYLKINDKNYYYSYNLKKDAPLEVKSSYRLVDSSYAQTLLKSQME